MIKNAGQYYASTQIYDFFNAISQSQIFVVFILFTIGVNTVSLCFDRYPIDPDENALLEEINNVCTLIFIVELVIKVIGLGINTYVSDSMNQFDALVVIISIVEYSLVNKSSDEEGGEFDESSEA